MNVRAFAWLLGCAALAGCSKDSNDALPGTLERDRVELVAEANETIVSLPFAEGATVKPGDIIAVQNPELAGNDVAGAQADVAQAEARLTELTNGPRATTIRAAVARRDAARAQRDDAVRERDRLLDLVKHSLVSKSEADRQVTAADSAEAALRAAEAELRDLPEGTLAEQISQARQAADAARARLASLKTTNARLEVRAPIAATIDALPYRVGEKPARGATIAVLLANTAPYARVHVPEPLRARVASGTRASVHVDGNPHVFSGKVRFIASDAEFTPYFSLTAADRSRLSFLAEVTLDEPEARELPAGVPVQVSLDLTSRP